MAESSPEFIKTEFDCFVRIGGDPAAREQISPVLEALTAADGDGGCGVALTIHIEVRDGDGEMTEIISLHADQSQLKRLRGFLDRFSVADVRLIRQLMDG